MEDAALAERNNPDRFYLVRYYEEQDMAYYSDYRLDVYTVDEDGLLDFVEPGPELKSDCVSYNEALRVHSFVPWVWKATWYEWHTDMCALSRRWPGLLFRIERVGEGYPDIEAGWFQNGRCYREPATVVFGCYDAEKLHD